MADGRRTARSARRRVTMWDVARKANVSQSTVSYVINDNPNVQVAPATRERIWEAVRELGYRRNAMAQGLRSGTSAVIGFLTDEIATTLFAGKIIAGAQDAAWDRRTILLVVNTGSSSEIEERAVEMMLEHRVRGIIYSTWFHRAVVLPPAIDEVPTVLANCYTEGGTVAAVVPDEVQGARLATATLIERGHRRIGFIDASPTAALPPATVPPAVAATRRLEGYRAALGTAGIALDDSLVVQVEPVQDGGYGGARELLEREDRPSALFCFNDRTAMGAYTAIAELGLRVPEDVAVIGFDNQEILAAYSRPPLTTIELPHYEMGRRALQRLMALIEDQDADAGIETIRCPLIERGSV